MWSGQVFVFYHTSRVNGCIFSTLYRGKYHQVANQQFPFLLLRWRKLWRLLDRVNVTSATPISCGHHSRTSFTTEVMRNTKHSVSRSASDQQKVKLSTQVLNVRPEWRISHAAYSGTEYSILITTNVVPSRRKGPPRAYAKPCGTRVMTSHSGLPYGDRDSTSWLWEHFRGSGFRLKGIFGTRKRNFLKEQCQRLLNAAKLC